MDGRNIILTLPSSWPWWGDPWLVWPATAGTDLLSKKHSRCKGPQKLLYLVVGVLGCEDTAHLKIPSYIPDSHCCPLMTACLTGQADKLGRALVTSSVSQCLDLPRFAGMSSHIITDGELNSAMIVSKEHKVKTIKKCALKCPVSVSCHQKLIAVSDCSIHNVKIIRTSGYLKQILGSYGDRPFQLFRPFGVCMDQKGRVVVCDYGNKRVVRFTMGGYCGASNQWEILLTPEQLEYCHPCHVTIATSGLVAVSLQTETGVDKIALFTGYHWIHVCIYPYEQI